MTKRSVAGRVVVRSRAGLLAVALALAAWPPAVHAQTVALDVSSSPIERFDPRTPVGARYGALIFLGGLRLKSADQYFGGLSGLRVSPDGRRFTTINDRGDWFTGTISYEGSRPVAVSDVARSPVPGRDGEPLRGRRGFDTEGLEIRGTTAWVSSERVHWLTRYALDADGRPTGKGRAVALPTIMAKAPRNQGYEAIAALASGALVMIGEKHLDADGDNRAFVIGGKAPLAFSVKRTDDFSPTDLTRLPSGDFALLERRYLPPFSLAVRIRRLAEADIRADATIDGPTLMEATLAQTIDNFEAISAHAGADGKTVLTVLSDDNFGFLQRTLLMQFSLAD